MQHGSPDLRCLRVTRGRPRALLPPSAVFTEKYRSSSLHPHPPALSGWPKHERLPRQPFDTRSPPQCPPPTTTTSFQPCTYCISAAKLCLRIFFNRRLSLDTWSHDKLFLPLFFFLLLMLCSLFMHFACFIFLLLVFSFLKLAFWSCFANNRHAFVLFFVLNGVGGDDSAHRSTLGC